QNSHAEIINAGVVAYDRETFHTARVQSGDEILRYPAQPESAGSDRHVVVKQAVQRSLGVRVDFAHLERLTTDYPNASETARYPCRSSNHRQIGRSISWLQKHSRIN